MARGWFRRRRAWRPRVWEFYRPVSEFPVRVFRVIDGDSVMVACTGPEASGIYLPEFEVRLFGIDAPELERGRRPLQRGAVEAGEYLSEIALGREFTFRYLRHLEGRRRGFGRRGPPRLLGVLLRRRGLMSVNREMIQVGWAHRWVYTGPLGRTPVPGVLNGAAAAERIARENSRGLWAYPPEDRMLPEDYRRLHPVSEGPGWFGRR